MKYYISTICDVTCEETADGGGKLSYLDRTMPLAVKYGTGIEIAEFCISENMDPEGFENVLPHVEACAEAVRDKVLHAPYNELYPMAIDSKVVDVARMRYDQAWQYCLRFGADKMIVHANYIEDLYYPTWFVSRHLAFWKEFLEKHPENVTICIENVLERTPDQLLEIVRKADDPRLRLCIDVGHANLSETAPEDWVDACAPYISHYHIHNNTGPVTNDRRSIGDRHSALGCGSIDMYALLQKAESLTPDATAAIESYDPESSVVWLKEKGFI